jgi:competence protein ComEC
LIVENFYTTIAAIIFTLPLILFQFGTLSIVAPLVNVLILWIIPWLMLGGLVALAVGIFFLPLGRFIAGGVGVGMDYVLWVVSWFGSLSWSAASLRIPVYLMALSYSLLIYIVWRNKKNIEN